jgi:hypothetical protein
VKFIEKNIIALFLSLVIAMVVVSCSFTGRSVSSLRPPRGQAKIFEKNEPAVDSTDGVSTTSSSPDGEGTPPSHGGERPARDGVVDSLSHAGQDSLAAGEIPLLAKEGWQPQPDGVVDTLSHAGLADTIPSFDSLPTPDSTKTTRKSREQKPFLEAPVVAKADDSLVYDVRRRFIYHYKNGDLTYQDNNLKADYIVVNANNKEIFGAGALDSAGVMTRPEFGNSTMDTVIYNLDSKKALVSGVATKDGEGFMLGRRMKRMPDNTINIEGARYTTCDRIDHPHFYIAMTKAKTIPGKKVITGPAYFVMEDVPIYFLGIPGGFFPISTGPTAGLIMPTWGEEGNRGFYLRGLGYYFTFGDHLDLRLTSDLYTRGSWGVNAGSNYIWRYKFRGSFNATYNNNVTGGERNDPDYRRSNTFSITWNHSQDPKANPRQTFSANVNFSTSGQKQLATTSLQDHLNTNTSSSISYSRNWMAGSTNINMTAQFNLSTRSGDSTLNVTLPNISLSVGSFSPFKRKAEKAVGKQRWYEKITMSYSMQAQNSTGTVKEYEVFSRKTLKGMQNGVTHTIPVKTSFNLLGYINFSPSFNYRESWNFKKQYRQWDHTAKDGQGAAVDERLIEPEFGFYRTYDWDLSGSFSTKLYGIFESKRPDAWLRFIRHIITPTLGFTYAPNFKHPRYGFFDYVQNSPNGSYTEYQPVQGSPRLSPGAARAALNFSLGNQVEIKTRSQRDSTGMKKTTVIEQFSLSSSYNFLAPGDSMQLAPVAIQLRSGEIFKGFSIQLSGTWDPYLYVKVGDRAQRTRHYNIGHGKFGRITQTSWSFGHTFNSRDSKAPDPRSINGAFVNTYNPYDFSNNLDPVLRRQYMVAEYYDFNVPWSLTFNYNVNYTYTGLKPEITQSLGFNGSVTPTAKWGVSFQSGYDFTRRKLSHMMLSLTRDLHCWEMSFQWVPMGRIKSYSFHIGVKSGMLADIKYDKSSNMYDNLVQ